jgi:cytochrome P450
VPSPWVSSRVRLTSRSPYLSSRWPPPTLPLPFPTQQALPAVLDLTQRVAGIIAAAGPDKAVDVADLAKRITSDVMGGLLFGEDLGGVAGK